jgi:3-oxo-5alpha-steroid 4-dehydrogenase
MGKGIFVNQSAQRFINEDTYFGHIGQACLQQQDGGVFMLHDDATYERNILSMEPSHVASSVEELESEANFPPGALVQTVEYYNFHARKGLDPLFYKRAEMVVPLENPPYALLDCRPEHCVYAGFTTGGLRTPIGGEVLNVDGHEIPGLYAAGRSAALLSGSRYPASGISLADGTLFGRCAGRSAAANAT